MKTQTNSSVLLIYTGGTIGMKTDPATGTLVPFDFNDIYEEFPYVRKLGVEIEVITFEAIDSSNVKPELWIRLARLIKEKYDLFDGFVVLHGTDTMSYSASALSFMLEDLEKPVVFTGSQIPIGVMRTDGRENLITAIEIAAARRDGHPIVPEVCLYFQNKLLRANRSRKHSAEELDAFRSENFPPLAEVGVNILYDVHSILRPGEWGRPLTIHTELETNIMVVKIFPGMAETLFRAMMTLPQVEGIVLETFGAGNAPTEKWFTDIVSDVVGRGIPVVNVTQCPNGSVDMALYETGVRLMEAGVVSGYDSTTEAAVTKLMYLLGTGLTGEPLREQLRRPLRGEITV